MNGDLRNRLVEQLTRRFGAVGRLPDSQSLFDVGEHGVRLYVRYSRIHPGRRTFYGLRRDDLRALEGRRSFICFLWPGQPEPLFVPYADYEAVFEAAVPARDGQYKVQIHLQASGTELYIARVGRFNVDGWYGFSGIEQAAGLAVNEPPLLSHAQIQTLLGSIGSMKQFDVWIPPRDRPALDWSLATQFAIKKTLPLTRSVHVILQDIDAIWFKRGSTEIAAIFEVEHSTPIYSGLLRLNDVFLALPRVERLGIVSNEVRRALFARQVNRPTFERSGLRERCSFLEYGDVLSWYRRLVRAGNQPC